MNYTSSPIVMFSLVNKVTSNFSKNKLLSSANYYRFTRVCEIRVCVFDMPPAGDDCINWQARIPEQLEQPR